MKSNKKITLLVVTYNRTYCVERLLKYYVARNFDQNIIVADASDSEFIVKNKLTYQSVKGAISLTVKFLKGYSVVECLEAILDEVSTPYVVLNPDDDFLIPSSLNKMSKFLDDNPSYAGVNGNALLQEEGICNNRRIIKGVGKYEMRSVYGKDSLDRADNLLKNYFGVLFSVFRTEDQKSNYRSIPGEGIIAAELIPAYRSVSHGNIAHIDLLYLIRSAHENRINIPKLYEQILDPSWSDNIKFFRDDFNKFIELNHEIGEQFLKFDNIMANYFAKSLSVEKKHFSNFYFQRVTAAFKKSLKFSELFMIKGYKNPFYSGSKELKFVVDIVESNLENKS